MHSFFLSSAGATAFVDFQQYSAQRVRRGLRRAVVGPPMPLAWLSDAARERILARRAPPAAAAPVPPPPGTVPPLAELALRAAAAAVDVDTDAAAAALVDALPARLQRRMLLACLRTGAGCTAAAMRALRALPAGGDDVLDLAGTLLTTPLLATGGSQDDDDDDGDGDAPGASACNAGANELVTFALSPRVQTIGRT